MKIRRHVDHKRCTVKHRIRPVLINKDGAPLLQGFKCKGTWFLVKRKGWPKLAVQRVKLRA
jgi:hypothetical protein